MKQPDPTLPEGWGWFEIGVDLSADNHPETGLVLALASARCFRGADGEMVLRYLRALTLDRALGPNASDTMLRHLEGQRQLVSHIVQLVQRGRDGG
jgi:hypothetical protein